MSDILDWQRRFAKCPRIWTVVQLGETTGNYYWSKEDAELEAAFLTERGWKVKVSSVGRVHSTELARERWAAATPADQEKGERRG